MLLVINTLLKYNKMNFNAILLENGNSWGNNGEGQQCHNKVEN